MWKRCGSNRSNLRAKSHPEALSVTTSGVKKGKSIAFDDVFLGGSSTWARTRDLRINRKVCSSKTLINQQLTCKNTCRVINRVIDQKVTLCNFPAKTVKSTFCAVILNVKVRRRLGARTKFLKSSTPCSDTEL